MHRSVLAWVPAVLADAGIAGTRVLEVGSCDVNGSVRPAVEALGPAWYVGVDQQQGPMVDRVVSADQLVDVFGAASFDVVISTEMLEHVTDWRPIVLAMVEVLDDHGLLVVTTRSEGFPYHAFPDDWWRFSVDAMTDLLDRAGLVVVAVAEDPQFPGVFATGRKPAGWQRPDTKVFDGVGVTRMPQP